MADKLLSSPTEEAARRIAKGFLNEATEAFARLNDADDAEAMHDFRVSLRRLRSTLRAYNDFLPAKKVAKLRRRFGELQDATSPARDAEVLLLWMGDLQPHLDSEHAATAQRLRDALAKEKHEALRAAAKVAYASFPDLMHDTAPVLRRYTKTIDLESPDDAERTGSSVAALLATHASQLDTCLLAVKSEDDELPAHRARIAGKRLRYLLEPFAAEPNIKALVKELKGLQDALGELHDRHVFARVLAERNLRAETRQVLVEKAQEEARGYFEGMKDDWLFGKASRFVSAVMALGEELAHSVAPGTEIERKYLLRDLPAAALSAPHLDVVQGYLPGNAIIERLRKVSNGGNERYFRTIKTGKGLVRTEVEEPISRELFEGLWPLTAGKRVEKRRYKVQENGHVWEVDAFTDRVLVLAEVELTSANDDVSLPDWLASAVVREVTDEDDYVNVNLAK